ncbi:hypothetical protein NP493_540g02014 [Ridgeia piscesae]|uniref:Prolyl 4-hydroxylase alpha subunit domain-containing protein n=1 Tax=Ridgeia piscesae TaxID=27915 RepID=A0AAD9KW89_RIDPI|nr:hypothetical protein NP493_540g02014 [Ridgeia piscesae]
MRDITSVTQHPVALYKLRRRLGTKWPRVLDLISETELMKTVPNLSTTLAKFRKILRHEADLVSAVEDLLRLQRLYSLRTRHLAEGRVLDAFSAPLDDDEIFELGQALVDLDNDRLAVEWLEAGVALVKGTDHDDTRTHYMNVIASSYLRMNRYVEAKTLYENLIEKEPNNRAARSSLKLLKSKLELEKRRPEVERHGAEAADTGGDDDVELWQRLCDRHDPTEHKNGDDPRLLCYKKYLNISDEYIRLEEVMLKPRLVLIHDVFTHRQTHLIVREATAEMRRYMAVFDDRYWQAKARTALHLDNAWTDGLLSRLSNITLQKSNVTDERVMAWIEVSNTGPGTQGKHIVVDNVNKVRDHGQIVHYMLFLNDVRGGGNVVFPEINLRIKPIRGAALVWQYKSAEDESRRQLDHYVQCPVLLGSQWCKNINFSTATMTCDL